MKEQKFWGSPPPQDHLEKNFRSGAATTQNCHKHSVKHRHRIVKHCMKYKYRIVTNTVWNTNTTQNCQTHYVKHKHNHRIVKHKHHTETSQTQTLLEAQQQHPTCFGFACFGRDSCLTWCGKCFFCLVSAMPVFVIVVWPDVESVPAIKNLVDLRWKPANHQQLGCAVAKSTHVQYPLEAQVEQDRGVVADSVENSSFCFVLVKLDPSLVNKDVWGPV